MKKILAISLISISLLFLYLFWGELTADIKDALHLQPEQYYGATVDMSQILPESDHYVVNSKGEDLIDQGAKLGMNMFRITNIKSPKDEEITKSYTEEQWAKVLNKMRKKGMSAVILVESNAGDSEFFVEKEINDYYLSFLKNYIEDGNLCSFSNIIATDIRNEPILTENNIAKLREGSRIVKSICPEMKVTIGSWGVDTDEKLPSGEFAYGWHDPRAAKVLDDIVDLHAIHVYGFDKPKDGKYPDPYEFTITYINEVKKYTNKPLLIEEFGSGNGEAISDQETLGSKDLQKEVYEGLLKATSDYKEEGVIGALAYLFHPRSDNPESWNISKQNGDILFPAAYTFKKYEDNLFFGNNKYTKQ